MSFADKFNLLNEFNILRIICALFFIPHIVAKFTVPQALQFYVNVGFKPPAFWMYLAGSSPTRLTCVSVTVQNQSTSFLRNPTLHRGFSFQIN